MISPGGAEAQACAYLVSRYPSVTHTFVLGEVRALRAAGLRVETASVRRVPASMVLSPVDREEQARTRSLVPAAPTALVHAHVRALRRSPSAYARTFARALAMAHAGGRPRLWQVFYFAEAILLWAWMEAEDLRHVHVHHANVSADLALLACAFANASAPSRRWTWSLTLHGPTELADVEGHKLAAKVHDASAVLCVSDFAHAQVLAFADPVDAAKLVVVRCGIDVDAFRRAAPAPAPAEHGIEILTVAALSRRKGHAVLLEALAQMRAGGVAARLTLVGDGEERARLEALARALGLAGHVHFAGALGQDQVGALYERAHAFCLPSFAEGVPIVLMEAMAMELPVVATSVMGVSELVEHERSGLLVAPARADLLAAALMRVAGDPDLGARLGAAGHARVARDYEIHRAAAEVRAALAPVLSASQGVG